MSVEAPDDADIAEVRRWIGDDESITDDEIYDAIINNQSIELTAQYFLETRLGNLLDGPASFSVPGYSESNSAVIPALQSQIDQIRLVTGTSIGAVKSVRLFRPDANKRSRRW